MTISTETRVSGPFIGDGAIVNLDFDFKVFDDSEVQVLSRLDSSGVDTELTLGVDYTVTLSANQDVAPGGRVILASALASGRTAFIVSQVSPLQASVFTNSGGFYPTVLNDSLDRLHALHLENREVNSRAVVSPVGETGNLALPPVANRVGKYLYFDVNGDITASNGTDAGTAIAAVFTDLASTASGKGAWLVKWIHSLSGSVARWVGDRLRDTVSVKDFGAVGDDATDNLAAFQAAAAASAEVYLPAGIYKVSGTINISKEDSNWHGPGIIKATTANLPIFTIASGISGTKIRVAELTRSVTATAGGNGIECSTVSVGQAIIGPMKIEKQYIGANLGPTDYSYVKEVIFENCVLDGATVTNTAADGACQWQFKGCLAQFIGRNGYTWQTIAGPAQMTAGDMESCDAYACSGHGLVVNGTAGVPIMDFSMNGGFYGESGDSVIYINTYGRNTTISGVLAELAGRSATGVNAATPASLVGCGFEITSNNVRVQLDNCLAPGNSYDGFYEAATITCFNGCSAENNGQSAVAGRRNGLNSVGGYAAVNGGYWGNTAGSSQEYGCFITDGNNLSVIGATFLSNGVAAFGATGSATYITSIGNLPNTLNVGLAPAGPVLVGGGATGGFGNGAGTINAGAGTLKNNTAYTNP